MPSPLPAFPPSVHRYVARVFREANRRLGDKIRRVPNCPEPSLDTTLIEHLSHFSAPAEVSPGWAVRIDVHFLGGMRHFRQWEIADIGVLVFAMQNGTVISKKMALLQSKRLYPASQGVREESEFDYRLGMGRLLPGSKKQASLGKPRCFKFSAESAYRALQVGNDQYNAIGSFERERRIPVFYLMYNPWKVPSEYELPLTEDKPLGRSANGGARVIPASSLRAHLFYKSTGYEPSFGDFENVLSMERAEAHGWRLEQFISYRLLRCEQGRLFESEEEDDIGAVFYRRSGPIAAAVSVTIEQFRVT